MWSEFFWPYFEIWIMTCSKLEVAIKWGNAKEEESKKHKHVPTKESERKHGLYLEMY